jgi:transposase
MILKQNAGIDLSMDDFEINLSVLDDNFEKRCLGKNKFPNNTEGFKSLIAWVKKKKDLTINESYTLEFTGVYYECLAYYLKENGKIVHMVIPSKSKKYCESLSIASKTDKLDAQALSWLGLERKLKEWEPISGVFLRLRALTREREEVLKEKTIVSNRLHAMNKKVNISASAIRRYEARMELLKSQVKEIEEEVQMLIKEDEGLEKKFIKVLTIPGVGFITAATIIAETNGFAAILNQKQLTSYAGLDVKLKESGRYVGKSKISKQGNSHIRRILHFPAQTAIIYNKPLSVFYERVNAKKIKAMIAGVGVQRKLLCLIYAIWKNDRAFDSNYEINKYHYEIQKVG